MDRMSEERFEAWLKENADDYNRPPANVPRDEMWETIARARQARPSSVAGHIGPRGSAMRYAVAASLIMGAGIGLGYWMRGGSDATPATTTVAATMTAQDSAIRNVTYDVASVQHLTAVEAMLTSYKSSEESATDVAMKRWAKDLLSSTRLLMDSPAGEDPGRRQLLEDLEYVLAQIVQLDPNAPAEDRALLQRSINREQVLTRIRSSIPAGFSSGN
jgi:hypothetical protein